MTDLSSSESVRTGLAYIVVVGGLLMAAVFLWHWNGNTTSVTILSTIAGFIGIVLGFYYGSKTADQAHKTAEQAQTTAEQAHTTAQDSQKTAEQAQQTAANAMLTTTTAQTNADVAQEHYKVVSAAWKTAEDRANKLDDVRKQYAQLVDSVSERVRSLGGHIEGHFADAMMNKFTDSERDGLKGLKELATSVSKDIDQKKAAIQDILATL